MSGEATRTALVRAEKDEAWTHIKSLVLDSVTSPHSKRAYEQALDAFERWCAETGGPGGYPGFTKATVQAYRAALEAGSLAASSINIRLSALRKLAAEAADNGLLAPEVASAVSRVRGAKRHGVRVGNWLTLDQAERLLELPGSKTKKGKRDRALLALLVGCGLRRQELAGLRIEDLQQRDGRWCIVDLAGKANRVRTVPMPPWAKAAVDDWLAAAQFPAGRVLGAVNKGNRITGQGMSANRSTKSSRSVRQRSGRIPRASRRAAPLLSSPTRAGHRSNRSRSRSGMPRFRRRSGIWASTRAARRLVKPGWL